VSRGTLQAQRKAEAFGNIGRRCCWVDEAGTPEGFGVIRNVTFRGGWACYRVVWDDEASGWWGSIVSAVPSARFVVL